MPRLARFVLALALLLPAALLALALTAAPAAAQYHFYFGRNKIQYEGFDWHVLRTDHFDIYYYPEMQALAENGAHFAEEAYAELENRFDFSLNHRVPLIFYSSNLHFKQTNITPGFIPDGVGGFFEFLKGRVVIPANGNIHRFRRVIRHELVHVFTYSKLARVMRDHRRPLDGVPPLWFTEGLAEYWSGEPDFQHEMILRDAVASNYFVPLENLDRIYGHVPDVQGGRGRSAASSPRPTARRSCSACSRSSGATPTSARSWRPWSARTTATSRTGGRRGCSAQYFPKLDEADAADAHVRSRHRARLQRQADVLPARRRPARGRLRGRTATGTRTSSPSRWTTTGEPMTEPRVLVKGERSGRFEAFHFFESRMDVSAGGKLAFVTKSGEADVIHVYDLERRRAGDRRTASTSSSPSTRRRGTRRARSSPSRPST